MSAPQKIVDVEPTPEGPKVKAKRPMSEAQLAALKKGRDKLAEKRKQMAEAEVVETQAVHADLALSTNGPAQKEPVDHVWENQPQPQPQPQEQYDDGIEPGYAPLCVIV
jgi:hypothetical protein